MKELFIQIVTIQDLAAKRGLEYIMAAGTKWMFYPTPDFKFTPDGVEMVFHEDTRHDCPDTESIELSIAELEMSDEAWSAKMEEVKAARIEREKALEERRKTEETESKMKQLERLKKELGITE